MRFLLLLTSFIFSFIFYVFHNETIGKTQTLKLNTIYFEPGVISVIFFIIGIFFFIYFSDFKKDKEEKTQLNFKELIKLLYENIINLIFLLLTPLGIYYVFYNILNLDYNYLSIIDFILFILFYFVLIKIKVFKEKKHYRIIIKSLSLIFLYLSTIFGIIFIIKQGNNNIIYFILSFAICFNFFIHFKFKNYISLFFSIISLFFLGYKLLPLLNI